jgi:hypothetical protein
MAKSGSPISQRAEMELNQLAHTTMNVSDQGETNPAERAEGAFARTASPLHLRLLRSLRLRDLLDLLQMTFDRLIALHHQLLQLRVLR